MVVNALYRYEVADFRAVTGRKLTSLVPKYVRLFGSNSVAAVKQFNAFGNVPESNEISGYCRYLWKPKKRAVVSKLITRASYVLPLELIWWSRFTSLIISHGVQMDPISLLKLNGSCLPISWIWKISRVN